MGGMMTGGGGVGGRGLGGTGAGGGGEGLGEGGGGASLQQRGIQYCGLLRYLASHWQPRTQPCRQRLHRLTLERGLEAARPRVTEAAPPCSSKRQLAVMMQH